MTRGPNNRGQRNVNDDWLTPPALLEALGPFDFDPCCPPRMPWRTAKVMLSNGRGELRLTRRGDGLAEPWKGRVLLNNPFSLPLPWVLKMSEHGRGIVIAAAKSTDSRWGQHLLKTSSAILFLDDRISFCDVKGRQSTGKWSPYMLCAYGQREVFLLDRMSKTEAWAGVLMRRVHARVQG